MKNLFIKQIWRAKRLGWIIEDFLYNLITNIFKFRKLRILCGSSVLPFHNFQNLANYDVENVIKEANKIIDGWVKVLGFSETNVGIQPDWHRDFISGYRWPEKSYYKNVRFVKNPAGAEIKVPWELSRFHHLLQVGKAYMLTNDKKYQDFFNKQLLHWALANPYKQGVNWSCTMEVGIRTINLIHAFGLFNKSLDNEFKLQFNSLIFLHGKFIRSNPENNCTLTNNHYLADLLGLLWVGLFLKDMKQGEQWAQLAINELGVEMKRQIREDGVCYEDSPAYHALITEMYLLATMAILENPDVFGRDSCLPDFWLSTLKKMLDFLAASIMPDGRIVNINDSDDGRILPMSNYFNKHNPQGRHLLAVGSVLLKCGNWKGLVGQFPEESYWLLGEKGKNIYESQEEKILPETMAFSTTGFYAIRNENDYLFVDCLKRADRSPTGHRHNGRLSFVLWVNNYLIVCDPGTFSYTGKPFERNWFRSTVSHNTLVVDGKEQNCLGNSIFELSDNSGVSINRFEKVGSSVMLDAVLFSEEKKHERNVFQRRFCFQPENGVLDITDTIVSQTQRSMLRLHLNYPCFKHSMNSFLIDLQDTKRIKISFSGKGCKYFNSYISPCKHSPSYGLKTDAFCIEAEWCAEDAHQIITRIECLN